MADMTAIPHSTSLDRKISRADIGCLVLAEFFVAALSPLESKSNVIGVIEHIATQNLFFLFAILVAAKRFRLSDLSVSPSKLDILAAVLATLLFTIVCLFGVEQLAGLGLSIVLVPLFITGQKDKNFFSALLVCSALALNVFWGPLIFQTFTAQIIAFDSSLLKWAYAYLRPDIAVQGVTFVSQNGFGIVIVGVCSVFNSASVAFLATTAISQFVQPGLRGRDGIVTIIVLLTIVLINTSRLILMGWDRSLFAYWHDGAGGPVISAVQTIIIAIIATSGAIWAAREKRS
jgi:hypothetical protein